MKVNIIACFDRNRVIGKDGKIPWKLPSDLRWFRLVTTRGARNAVIMGRKTYESLPCTLPDRLNIVLSKSIPVSTVASYGTRRPVFVRSYKDALDMCTQFHVTNVFCVGGENIYREAMLHPGCRMIYTTELCNVYTKEGDAFFPSIDMKSFYVHDETKEVTERGISWKRVHYRKRTQVPQHNSILSLTNTHQEYQYLGIVKDIIDTGVYRDDRTGTGTVSKFGVHMRFDLSDSFPLLTTKRVFFRGVIEELLWFMRGETNSKILSKKGVRFWDDNGSRKNLDDLGFHDRKEGDLGPVYGFQWRNFGATYSSNNGSTASGVDQLRALVDNIRDKPNSRRHIISAWNPAALNDMVLPPCHILSQFWVNNGRLSCQLYQRSGDMGLGVPFNIASYSALTYIIANICDLEVGEFIHTIGDAHVYMDHIDPLKTQCKRTPHEFPFLRMKKKLHGVECIDDLCYKDFDLQNYHPHSTIKMNMST